jgi:hypothetical protein
MCGLYLCVVQQQCGCSTWAQSMLVSATLLWIVFANQHCAALDHAAARGLLRDSHGRLGDADRSWLTGVDAAELGLVYY